MSDASPTTPSATQLEQWRRKDGLLLYAVGISAGLFFLLMVVALPSFLSRHASVHVTGLALGALLAMPMLAVYLFVPWIVDRYDPRPTRALLMALAWGGIAACGFAVLVNTTVHVVVEIAFGKLPGEVVSACISAPLVEELMKGAAVFLAYRCMRRDFNGVVDGVVYATFAALGFAAVENVLYYGKAFADEVLHAKHNAVYFTFGLRGLLTPWVHPLFTAMTGLGFGIARETTNPRVRRAAPILGLAAAVFLHSLWNTCATASGFLMVVMLPLWSLFVLAFAGLLGHLVARKGKIIRAHLRDEVLMGTLTQWELDLVTSPFARLRASMSYGGASGRRFVDAAVRLALSKWHVGRAAMGRNLTVSVGEIAPLRRRLVELRGDIARSRGQVAPAPTWRPAVSPPPRSVSVRAA